jgi:hypothetical protein
VEEDMPRLLEEREELLAALSDLDTQLRRARAYINHLKERA